MKTKLFILLIFIFISSQVYSQDFQWRLLPNSPGTTGSGRYEDIFFINENTGWVISFGYSTYKTTDGGNSWTRYANSEYYNRSIGFFDSLTGVIGRLSASGTMMRTTNGGINYSIIGGLPSLAGICGISIVTDSLAYACGTYNAKANVVKTTDKGITWNSIFSDTSLAKTLVDCYFRTSDSGIAVGGYNNHGGYYNGNAVIIKTNDGGASWQRVHITNRTREWCWKISFISGNIGFVSIERETGFAYILKTTNNGLNWTDIPFMEYDEEGIGFVNENTGWVGGWTGPTYQTTNGGANWQIAGWGTNVNRFRFFGDTLGYAVGDRVYKYSRGPVGIQSLSNNIPEKFSLSQNYPNPFNPTTKIKFDLPSIVNNILSIVSLKIFDVLGKEVAKLFNEKLSPGSYEVEFNGSNFSSGIYFYKLETENFIQTKRMILLK
ncbi:MAG: T9SS type A sorting domain-containing protein [Bacteroidota bacterium]|nr:T9SS type A sorting domain-containing protein [Bacteroidota bacterium]